MEKPDESKREHRNRLERERYRRAKMTESKIFDQIFGQIDKLGQGSIEVLKAMTQASISNPLLGIATTLIFSDVLYRSKIIDIQTLTAVFVATGALEGTAVAGTVISDISNFFHLFSGQAKAPDPITPTANVVVLGDAKSGDLQSLLRKDANL